MKSFDLEKAMLGEPCVTRDGRAAKFLYKLSAFGAYKYSFVITDRNGEEFICNVTENGLEYLGEENNNDIFMASKTKKLWIAISKNQTSDGSYNTSFAAESANQLGISYSKGNDWLVEVEVEVEL